MRGKYKAALTGLAATVASAGTIWIVSTVAPLSAAAAAAADAPGALVEDFQYPGAAQILTDTHDTVQLISGDGHIVYGDCDKPTATGTGRLTIWTSNPVWNNGGAIPICFDVLGPVGVLNLAVTAVYEIDAREVDGAGATAASAKVTDDGVTTPVPLSLDRSTQVGRGGNPSSEPTTLVQLSVKR